MHFSLIHPSRNRLQRAGEAIDEWTSKLSGTNRIEYLLSIDSDDPQIDGYRALAARDGIALLIHPNRSIVDAVNRAAQASRGDVLIVVSDDFGCPAHWDVALQALIGDTRDFAMQVDDGIEARIITLPIVGRTFYERLGHIYHPEYFSLFCDDELTAVAKLTGRLIDARHLLFPHRHYVRGLAPVDATYLRQNSGWARWLGWRTFEKHRLTHFGSQPRTAGILVQELTIDARYYTFRIGSRIKRELRRWHLLRSAAQ